MTRRSYILVKCVGIAHCPGAVHVLELLVKNCGGVSGSREGRMSGHNIKEEDFYSYKFNLIP